MQGFKLSPHPRTTESKLISVVFNKVHLFHNINLSNTHDMSPLAIDLLFGVKQVFYFFWSQCSYLKKKSLNNLFCQNSYGLFLKLEVLFK